VLYREYHRSQPKSTKDTQRARAAAAIREFSQHLCDPMARQSFSALDVMHSNSEASAFKPLMKSRSFGSGSF
jgi:hypothetical protein